MIVSINQPAYLPSKDYFRRIQESDLHIVLDHVQLEKGGLVNRTQIRQRDGRRMWLTVPVEKGRPINRTRVDGGEWQRKHKEAIRQAYGVEYPALPGAATLDWICHLSTVWLNRCLDSPVTIECVTSSSLRPQGTKSDLVLNLCRTVEADVYLSGPHGRDYLDLPAFDRAGVEVRWFDYSEPQPPLSVLDSMFGKVAA